MKLWHKLDKDILSIYPDAEGIWKFPTKGAGWTWTEHSGKRNILYRQPCEGYFRVTIVLGEHATEKALSGSLPDSVKNAIKSVQPYMDGRSVLIDMHNDENVASVLELLHIKRSNQ
jgi:hypothetical protein